ncbi:hypothetical protein HYN59_03970 [Flavobacterium album]|uniref:Uncharacterized protein n=1 Tax=Flavobacterium album TaxID=2175091 RepID=A0A2S1QVB7_9FLAO|nr:hypothetical protein [Flavobacterium album]AWH84323.1 hypothetical protein HYN59_03970 [Flavobacterium album]
MNLKFNYLYRDASNYKNYGSVIFSNPNSIPLILIENAVRGNLIDGEFFSSEDWQLPDLFFEVKNSDDHIWHEFESIEATNENLGSCLIEDFLIRILLK